MACTTPNPKPYLGMLWCVALLFICLKVHRSGSVRTAYLLGMVYVRFTAVKLTSMWVDCTQQLSLDQPVTEVC